MARILALSSQVARGHVGLSAIVPALQRLGHDVIALPTVLLSNHPGHAHHAGVRIETDVLSRMIDALDHNGWLAEVDAVLTGYLPTVAHVQFAATLIARLKRQRGDCRIVCDPVLGDDPKGLYIDAAIANAIRERLVASADMLTPNRFELAFLTDTDITSSTDAIAAMRGLGRAVLATSIPAPEPDRLLTVLWSEDTATVAVSQRRPKVPNGTGDLLAALLLGNWLHGGSLTAALVPAARQLETIIAASDGADELRLSVPDPAWGTPA
jgi:pyridoxine kinase